MKRSRPFAAALAGWGLLLLAPKERAFASPRLVTFDLDDTLWPQDPVVARANAAMVAALQRMGAEEASAEAVSAEMKAIRRGLDKAISYSELRRQGIAALLRAAGCEERAAEDVFETWLAERHNAANELLFPGVQKALEELRSSDIVVGAVTNSRADPFAMEGLRKYFDFCVSGEQPGVFPHRKPSLLIYSLALERAEEVREGCSGGDGSWLHVGDDLPNDVKSSAEAGAVAVWISEGEEGKPKNFKCSTATPEEQEKRRREAEEAKSRVAARLASVAELPALLRSWASSC